MEPDSHIVPVSYFGKTRLPRSPSFAYFVSVNSPFPAVALYEPLARPHGSNVGACPGARVELWRKDEIQQTFCTKEKGRDKDYYLAKD